jgi:hypothetical protein
MALSHISYSDTTQLEVLITWDLGSAGSSNYIRILNVCRVGRRFLCFFVFSVSESKSSRVKLKCQLQLNGILTSIQIRLNYI